jgi:hypothetical protein
LADVRAAGVEGVPDEGELCSGAGALCLDAGALCLGEGALGGADSGKEGVETTCPAGRAGRASGLSGAAGLSGSSFVVVSELGSIGWLFVVGETTVGAMTTVGLRSAVLSPPKATLKTTATTTIASTARPNTARRRLELSFSIAELLFK